MPFRKKFLKRKGFPAFCPLVLPCRIRQLSVFRLTKFEIPTKNAIRKTKNNKQSCILIIEKRERTPKKMKSQNKKYLFLLSGFFILYCLFATQFGEFLYGSTVDWNSQHYKIPEYFRQLFYETWDLFPDFAANIGAGQNIYNFSYYGFLNPVILLSYFLPFIPMHIYLAGSTLVLVYASVILLYIWLSDKVPPQIAAFASALYTLAVPVMFHTHRHIMFVNYLPFLMLGLIGVDRYFKHGKKLLLPISVFLICMTSYFYSVGSVVAITLYGVYVYIANNEKFDIKDFAKEGVKFALHLLLGISMAAILLLPTFAALLGGRADNSASISLIELFIPHFFDNNFLYDAYGLGLTSIAIFSLIYSIIKLKKENRFLGIACSAFTIFPLFAYLLCAGMYARAKALIPLLPLYILIVALCMSDIKEAGKVDKICIVVFSVLAVYISFRNFSNKFLLLDFILTLAALLLCNVGKRKQGFLRGATVFIATLALVFAGFNETFVSGGYIETEAKSDELIMQAIETDEGYYRIADKSGGIDLSNRVIHPRHYVSSVYSSLSNQKYQSFYYDVLCNDVAGRSRGQLINPDNILFDVYMGNKYTVTRSPDKLGLKMLAEKNGLYLCQNMNAQPVGYASDKLMSQEQFDALEYPYDVEALLNYVIVDNAEPCEYETSIREIDLDYEIVEQEGVEVEHLGYIQISAKKDGKLILNLNEEMQGKLLFIRFDLLEANNASIGDNQIVINGVENRLPYKGWTYNNQNYSFEYTISDSTISQLDISFMPGVYKIRNIKVYTADYNSFVAGATDVAPLIINQGKTKGDVIEGDVAPETDGYFQISIPYDKGFTVYVDGQKTSYEKTDTSFMGFKLDAGSHHIKIVYRSPMKAVAAIISVVAIAGFGCMAYKTARKGKKFTTNKQGTLRG